MSVPRLTFLYPHLYRSLRVCESTTPKARLRSPTQHGTRSKKRNFSTAEQRNVPQFVQRHGKAVEPFVPEGQSAEDMKIFTPSPTTDEKIETNPSSSAPLSDETQAAAFIPGDDGKEVIYENVPPKEEQPPAAPKQKETAGGPIETILHMPTPESVEEENAAKPPHLQTPPYVHHFDTYTLVQQVEAGGFTTEQSVTSMKAVRGLLAQNLDVAKAGLVSKSDVENETYLFRAACSELRTEIQNSRKKQEETMRRERTLLQHEVDILNQKLTQELLTLKDDLKGMFDDRKMSVRSEQRAMESKIQELNYKITVMLNSDSKSEVEGLRWVLTRRSVMGILFMAFMVLTSLRYASYKSHEDEMKKKKEEEHLKASPVAIEDLPAQGAAEILAAN
ncbi:uncharacterized protein LY89DRAFT_641473 [Mollisia scopiformis]|uniref:Uncharacterized protein n=1 Tax=Mollisia scopiformis TaxID=149040 RepID=A0A194XIG4_MOLSC|nr:uncharacterized protein LY89DRAFT_641473 [Mollisia scopiformis]KUJ20020.1 hypothetical protein LY89DRAFT_641473 [Mollisia scopiformis]